MRNYIKEIIYKLEKINDDGIRKELRKYGLSIDADKYSIAFSCYGIARRISSLDIKALRGGANNIPESELERIRWISVIIFSAYTTFVYMRSNELENKLDNVEKGSCLNTYKEIFRKGKKVIIQIH